MTLEIKKYPDPILRKRCKEVKEVTPEIKKLIEDMIETMVKCRPEGVGLAASQIGELKKIFVVQTEKGSAVFINPRITKKSKGFEEMEEGCLSVPGIWLKIKRAKVVELEAIDNNGKKIKTKAEGLLSKILQHEIDHLNGILIVDRIRFIKRLRLKRQLAKIKAL